MIHSAAATVSHDKASKGSEESEEQPEGVEPPVPVYREVAQIPPVCFDNDTAAQNSPDMMIRWLTSCGIILRVL